MSEIHKPLIFNPDNPAIIFSMEKVGSTTVMETIQSAGLDAHRAYKENIKTLPHQNSRIITMVRDPIAWAISYYWEMPDAHPDKLVEPENFGSFQNFMLNLNLDYALTWLDLNFREIIGVNGFGQHFPKKKGWRIYSMDRILILNTHMLSDTLGDALSEFLGKDKYHPHDFLSDPNDSYFPHKAKGSERHGDQYQEFIEKVKFPRDYLFDLYESRYCFHFFTHDDRERWVEKWQK